jgi:hypothetical protein
MWAFTYGGGYGTCGALKFFYNGKLTSDAAQTQAVGPFIGVSWRILEVSSDQTGVTADVEGNYGDLQTFYSKTADGTAVPHEVAKGVTVMAAYQYHALDTQSIAVYVRYKLPTE